MKKNRGFSLIELLIAITILAIIMVMISGFMTSTVNSHTKNRREMQVQDEAMRIYSQVADMIMQATYVRITSADGEAYQYNKTSSDQSSEAKWKAIIVRLPDRLLYRIIIATMN